MNVLGNFFDGGNDEILFFILVFLLLFNGNIFGKDHDVSDGFDNSSILFFIILFLLLFFSGNKERDVN